MFQDLKKKKHCTQNDISFESLKNWTSYWYRTLNNKVQLLVAHRANQTRLVLYTKCQ